MAWLVAPLVLACGVMAAAIVAMRRRLEHLESALRDAHGEETVDIIAIEIKNHLELATSRTSFARPLAVVTPSLLRSIVQRETLKMMRSEMAENGVEADVRSRRVVVHRPLPSFLEDDPEPEDVDL